MVDRSNVEAPLWEFVVLADTHYVLPEKANSGEFETRKFQTARIGQAVELARHLDPQFVIHLGDLVQEFPGTHDFPESLRQAMEQLRSGGLTIHFAAGNHDVGDKPDPTTAAPWTTDEYLAYFHDKVGPSWFDVVEGDVHFIVLNTSIMNNTALAAEAEQWAWLEQALAAHPDKRRIVSYHIPAYVMRPDEPSLGHYDNVAEPARSRLLALFEQHDVTMVFQGHSHFGFVNDHGSIRMHVLPSTSAVRPGFSELFSSATPPAQGHNDADKLGLYLVRVYPEDLRVTFLRTQGPAAVRLPADDREILITGTPTDLPTSQLGVTLRHPIANWAEVPITFPSTVRQPVRNDYPLLSLLELGVRHVRIPGVDLNDPQLADRHAILHREGVGAVGTWVWQAGERVPGEIRAVADRLDTVEIQLPGDAEVTDEVLASLPEIAEAAGGAIQLCQVTLAAIKGVQMHRRQRYGYQPGALRAIDARLAAAGAPVDRAVVYLEDRDDLWELVDLLAGGSLAAIGGVDVLVEVGLQSLAADAWLAAEAMVALAPFDGTRIHVDTLMELDRTMDVRGGLLNRMCNPRESFKVLQTLNTVLHGQVVAGAVSTTERMTYGAAARLADGRSLLLSLPGVDPKGRGHLDTALEQLDGGSAAVTRYELGTGWVCRTKAASAVFAPSDPTAPYVVLTDDGER